MEFLLEMILKRLADPDDEFMNRKVNCKECEHYLNGGNDRARFGFNFCDDCIHSWQQFVFSDNFYSESANGLYSSRQKRGERK